VGQFTPLSDLDLDALVAAFALSPIRRAEALWAGTINSNFRLETDAGTLFLRVNEGKGEDEVAYEASLVAHLHAAGVPTPRPLLAADRPFARIGSHIVTLFPWIQGEHRTPAPAEATQLGAALARIHLAPPFPERRASRYAFPLIVERFNAIEGQLPPDTAADLRAELDALATRPALPSGIIHGDLFPDNVLWHDDRLVSLLDFEQASDGAFAYDLAVTLLASCFDDDFVAPRAAALVAGYHAVRPLVERDAVYDEARFAAVRFTVTRLTDVALNPAASPELRRTKDYRRWHLRSRRLLALGPSGFSALLVV
jgi:homoserine kinase type II